MAEVTQLAASQSVDTVEKAVSQAFYHLLQIEPFYAYLIVQMKRNYVTDVDPVGIAAVSIKDGQMNLHINRRTFPLFTLEERMAILKHEVMHLVLDHIPRRVHRNPARWNLAIDMAINWQIRDLPSDEKVEQVLSQFMTPEQLQRVYASGGFRLIYPHTFDLPDNMTAEWYYARLSRGNGGIQGDGVGDGLGAIVDGNGNAYSQDGRFWDGHGIWSESDAASPEQVRDIVRQAVVDAYQRLSRSNGSVPGNLKVIIEEWLKPTINWKQQLRQFVAQAIRSNRRYTWKRPSRRFPELQGTKKEYQLKLLIAGDSSASVSDREYAQFWAEIKRIHALGNVDITYMEVDTEIQRLEKFSRKTEPEVHGRGGTDLRVPFRWAEEQRPQDRPDAIIYFTDTGGPYPEKQTFPTLWVVPDDAWDYAQEHITWGRMIRLKVED